MAVVTPSHDGRVPAYVGVVVVMLGLAVAVGRPGLAAFAAPFVVALLLGLRIRSPIEMATTARFSPASVLEGDAVHATLDVTARPGLLVAVRVLPRKGLSLAPDQPDVFQLGPRERQVEFDLTAQEWGNHRAARLELSASLPGGLLSWQADIEAVERVTVLPRPLKLRALLRPRNARATAGLHASRRIGEGTDFAEIRPWVPGDRLRSINRQATARRRTPHVNQFHPERSGDVILLIDTFGDSAFGSPSRFDVEATSRAARAAWALAKLHLDAGDRVGFLSYGRLGSWLPPGGGDRARYRLLATVLDLGGHLAEGTTRWGLHPERVVPNTAAVAAFTPLWNAHAMGALLQLRRAGCDVVAVVVDTTDLLAPPTTEIERSARRLWTMEVGHRQRVLAAGGVRVVHWGADADVGAALSRTSQRAIGRRG